LTRLFCVIFVLRLVLFWRCRNFELNLGDLLEAKENECATFDTEKGLELNVAATLFFLNQNFYGKK
jgi:hypothetical protein